MSVIKAKKASGLIFCSLFLIWMLGGCSATLEIDEIRQTQNIASFKPVKLDVPFFAQDEYQCGPAALAMLLKWSAVDVSPEIIKPLVYVPEKQGSFPIEMVAAVRQFNRIPYVIEPSISALLKELEAGNPVLVFQNLGLDWFPKWHFAVVVGVDVAANQVTLHSGTIEKHTMTLDKFEYTWRRAKKWAMVAMRAGQLPETADSLKYIKAVSYFEKKGQLELARISYQAAIDRWPGQLIALMGLANISYLSGSLEDAEYFYQKAIGIQQTYAPAHNNLAMVLMKQGRLTRAQEHARKAVELGGSHTKSYQETLTEINQQLGNSGQ